MKKKILIFGKSKAVMDDFFIHLKNDFEVLSASTRYDDIKGHLRYYSPDAVVYCPHKESLEVTNTILEFKGKLEEDEIPLIIIGNPEECTSFQKETYNMAGLTLAKPISARSIGDKVNEFFKKIDEEKKAEQEEIEQEEETSIIESEAKSVQNKEEAIRPDTVIVREAGTEMETTEKKHVLVVDDDPMMLKLIKEHLKDQYAVGTAISGKIALKFLETKKTDLVILDYEMPIENGAQVMEKIRKNEATANLPIIFLTGVSEREKIQKVLSLKPQGYLLKPIEKDKLLDIITKTLR